MRNTVRHAGATHVRVDVGFEPDGLVLCVTDDGRGFVHDGAAELASGHLGLLGMAERANFLGGQLEVHSTPGGGTLVRVTLPRHPPGAAGGVLSSG